MTELRDRSSVLRASGASGACVNADCGIAWIDPMPEAASLARLYDSYHTHGEQA